MSATDAKHATPVASVAPQANNAQPRGEQQREQVLRVTVSGLEEAVHGPRIRVGRHGVVVGSSKSLPIGARFGLELMTAGGELLLHARVEVAQMQQKAAQLRFVEVAYEAQALAELIVALESERFGNYALGELLGRGGMAEVYKARAVRGALTGQQVALKRLRNDMQSQAVITELFVREARILESLRHPHIVRLLDHGVEDNIHYIAMDYVRGVSLQHILWQCRERDIRLPVDFSCYVTRCVAEALHHAHHATDAAGQPLGLVHRDVAPSNVFISDVGEILLGDFGVAQLGASEKSGTDSVCAGKGAYMAPEQIRGEAATPASDVFSLGAVFYELLTNTAVFGAESFEASCKRVLRGKVPPPSALRPEVPPEVDALVLEMLARRPPRQAPRSWVGRLGSAFGGGAQRIADARTVVDVLEPLYDPQIGTQLAIAAVVRNLFPGGGPTTTVDAPPTREI